MSSVEMIHEQAMDIAEEAFHSQRDGDEENATKLFLKALELEKQAFERFPPVQSSEPTRSILIRSAASMAFHAKEYEQAEQLVASGLSGYPPSEIKAELRALQDDIAFRRHILLEGIQLSENQLQMTLWGNATGYGVISAELLTKRIDQIKTVFYRTVERLLSLPYRTAGGPSKQVIDSFALFLNGFSAGSFGVSFAIGERAEQLPLFPDHLPKKVNVEAVIEEVLRCFELLQVDELEALRERFPNDEYLENFIGMARQMAPDGEAIKGIGISATFDGQRRTVGLRRSRKELPTLTSAMGETDGDGNSRRERFEITGVLKLADSLKIEGKQGIVKLRNEEKDETYSVRVPLSQMQDVVQPYFEEHVTISGYRIGKKLYLQDIDSVETSHD